MKTQTMKRDEQLTSLFNNYTVTLTEAASFLNYKDIRSVKSFCKKHNIKIFGDICERKYVLRAQLDMARMEKIIEHMKIQNGKDWVKTFHELITLNLIDINSFNIPEQSCNPEITSKSHHTKSQHELAFFQRLTEKIPELNSLSNG